MNRTALALTSAALMLTATTAVAEETEQPPGSEMITACGSTLTIEKIVSGINTRPSETGFAASGNGVLRISDEDSSIVVRTPGLASAEFTETSVTITYTGSTLLIPDAEFPFAAEALARAGLPSGV